MGGSIEFGESWQKALKREFLEELGVQIEVVGTPIVLENFYEHEGALGHEIIFAAQVTFPEAVFEGQDEILFQEDNGHTCRARWFGLDQLESSGIALFPEGLKACLQCK